MFEIRPYNSDTDAVSAARIWREINWIENEKQEKFLDDFIQDSRALVAIHNGEAESLAIGTPGTMMYLNEELPISVVTGITTSRIARKQGLAQRMTSRLIAEEAEAGAVLSTLGIFEQGFYNLFGYGSGGYVHWISFDPANLITRADMRVPVRLSRDDWEQMHHAMIHRRRGHGAVNLLPPGNIRAEAAWSDEGFGLGYCDGPDGELTHFIWGQAKEENGPWDIVHCIFQNSEQFHELMCLIKSLGDQVRLIRMREPAGIQLQDMIRHPIRTRIITSKGKYESINRATAYWQSRICDLEAALTKTRLPGVSLRFNLDLHDPIERYLNERFAWRGIGGRYVISLGESSSAVKGQDSKLPVLKASVGSFTRLWLGVRPASGLAITDQLDAEPALLDQLDYAFRLPEPQPGWDY